MASDLFTIGSSGVKAARTALEITSQNIANAATDGYIRRSVRLSEMAGPGSWLRVSDLSLSGVRVDGIGRNADLFRQVEVRRTGGDAARASTELRGFENIEAALGLPHGQMKVTVLIETLPAVFEMHEILHALRSRIVGLNCGRWDYIFSYLKVFRRHRDRVLPERGQVGMTQPFLKAYSELLVQTCHRRGAHAMGGMAAQIPIAGDPIANEEAIARVRADKQREVDAGHDGTWVAHPALIPVARGIFDAGMPGPNQHDTRREDVQVTRDALIRPSIGTITRKGFDNNVEVCVRYLAAWLDGNGCVPIHWLMEDAATAEISRAQIWQWLHTADVHLCDGTQIDYALLQRTLAAQGPWWSDPYFNETAGGTWMTTLNLPLRDRDARRIGMVSLDVPVQALSSSPSTVTRISPPSSPYFAAFVTRLCTASRRRASSKWPWVSPSTCSERGASRSVTRSRSISSASA